jgi:hypothetical protein
MTQTQIDQLVDILNNVKGHMTAKDVEEEFGYPAEDVRRVCRRYNITLLTHSERNLLYIKQVCEILPIDKIARNLGLGEEYVKVMAKGAGIKLLQPEKPLFLEGRRMRLSRQTTI